MTWISRWVDQDIVLSHEQYCCTLFYLGGAVLLNLWRSSSKSRCNALSGVVFSHLGSSHRSLYISSGVEAFYAGGSAYLD